VDLALLDSKVFAQQVYLDQLVGAVEAQTWDIALIGQGDLMNFPVYFPYHLFALDGNIDWVDEAPELRQLYEQVLGTVDRDRQQELIRQMERHTHEHAYFLFLYSPIGLYAVNKAVQFVPHITGILNLAETSVTEQHWSIRKQKAGTQE
jgi:ABC-type transport system substrate-binding protein